MNTKKIYINESHLKYIIKEMAYPLSFNINQFKEIPTFTGRINYCEKNLKRISSGSSRIVYLIDNDKVLKLAKNKKGIAQNLTEIRLGTEPYYTCFSKIYDYDENGLFVEMEYCRKAKKSEFKNIYGVPFESLCCAISDMTNNYYRRFKFNPFKEYQYIVDAIWNGEENKTQKLFSSVLDYITTENLTMVNDLFRISSWGISNLTNDFVIIDYGLDDDVFNNFYKRY